MKKSAARLKPADPPPAPKPPPPLPPTTSAVQRSASRLQHLLMRWARWQRILFSAGIALVVFIAIFPLVDMVYLQFFFTLETRIVPSLVSSMIGLGMYLWGWWLLVGVAGDSPQEQVQARPQLVNYFFIGLLALLVDVALIIVGVWQGSQQ